MFGIEAEKATENDNVETDDVVYNMTNEEPRTECIAVSDEGKMELYANKRIIKNTTEVKTNDLLYANDCRR